MESLILRNCVKLIETKINQEQCSFKVTRGNVIKANKTIVKAYHMLINLLKENHLIRCVHSLVAVKFACQVVLKSIHPSIPKEQIVKDLANIINIRNCVTKKKIPIHFISLKMEIE